MELTTLILFCSISYTLVYSMAADTIRQNQTIKDGETIISAGGEFELGFFRSGSSTNRYLGIWYKKISNGTVVWVANRETPLKNTLGVVTIHSKGIALLMSNESDAIIWSVNTSRFMKNPSVQLLDTGNLVLRDEDHGIKNVENIWQSFDHPADTMLPGMKFGIDLVTGINRYYTSWKSADDPSSGSFTYRLDSSGFPQFILWKDSVIWSRFGPWIGSRYRGIPNYNSSGYYKYTSVFSEKEIFSQFDLINKSSATMRVVLTPSGEAKILAWNDHQQIWVVYLTQQVTDCDHYGSCGANGICSINKTPRCECLRGFVPKSPNKWKAVDWSDGCVRKTNLVCGTEEGFVKYSGVKLPDTRRSWYNMTINLQECEKLCLENCSCTAYANADVRSGGHGCVFWFRDLIDIRDHIEDGQDIYVRMPSSELVKSERSRSRRQIKIFIISGVLTLVVIGTLTLFLFGLMSLYVACKKRKQQLEENLKLTSGIVDFNETDGEDMELPLFEFERIANATSNFSNDNKLGHGGYGPVYKGMLEDGQEIAVKRLSSNSSQGLDEFKNEVSFIAKLQHRNLVTLLGCCIEKGERILIYEYMANKSLDLFIFDEKIRNTMDWLKRYNIINGIARGLLYLHQDSKLRIIHRDLKASNILLDHEMNPKISDFGMARSFGANETEASTSRVVGTYGYMSPEYAVDGQFSVKSDVYSFGVLLIEIVTGMKNRLFCHPGHSLNLLGHAWICYNEERLLQLIDGMILESSNQNEAFRFLQIGLLCVQHDPKDRPDMSQVVLMLSSNMKLAQPKQPGFYMERYLFEVDHSLSKPNLSSSNDLTSTSNELTITDFLPRQ
ncbi:Receptor-like serine/threonine-protein kinase [Heracleum sosnowskyi]|uniref:Receptor-like serine/threonine-protein kinase n=1 Tax=Heracleum sosnowskyi TaxID=360622 RepID=A0AAD8GVU1_9APIA|nr:Receptor-like serine/threonine-protein kinase [Heracleum sosnowskyi]